MAQIKKKVVKTETPPRRGVVIGSHKMTSDEVKKNIKPTKAPTGAEAKVRKFLETPIIVKSGSRSDTTTAGNLGKAVEKMTFGRKNANQVAKDAILKSNKDARGYRTLQNKGSLDMSTAARYGRDIGSKKKA